MFARNGRIAALFAAASILVAQQRPDVRTTVQLILIPTSVTDPQGEPVEGLEAADFEVLVDGRIVPHDLNPMGQPIAVAVAVSTDFVSGPALEKVIKAAPMIQPVLAGERGTAAVFRFADDVEQVLPLTSNYDEIVRAFDRLRPEGNAVRMLDAVKQAAELLEKRSPKTRRLLLLIGHSRDQGSKTELSEILPRLQRDNITVYALTASPTRTAFTVRNSPTKRPKEEIGKKETPVNVPPFQVGKNMLDLMPLFRGLGHMGEPTTTQLLADFTGGMTQPFVKQQTLEKVIQKASLDIHSHYLLTITMAGDPGMQFHPLEVRVKRPNVTVRARRGYLGLAGAE